MSETASPRRAWIALASVDGIADGLFTRLVATFGSAVEVLAVAGGQDAGRAVARLRAGTSGLLSRETAGRIRAAALDVDAALARLARPGSWDVTPLDASFPGGLRVLEPSPLVLFGLGERRALEMSRCVAVVGTRHATPAGRALAARIAARLVECGAVVVSGLAVGIDGAAHAAAIEAGGRTVAVIGGGLDHPGPRAHDRLHRAILDRGGTILSEHAPEVRPTRGTFPRRNRIISGLSVGTVVVEAPLRSGALITARHALEQGRLLLVAPGRPGDASVAGCLAMLRESPARPLVGLDEMVVDLGLDRARAIDPPVADAGARPRSAEPVTAPPSDAARHLHADAALALLSPVERAVGAVLRQGPVTVDRVVSVTRLPAPIVAGALVLLQVRGWAHPLGPLFLPSGALVCEAPACDAAVHEARRVEVAEGITLAERGVDR